MEHIIVLTYPDDRGAEVVRFTFDNKVDGETVRHEIGRMQECMTPSFFVSLEDYVHVLCNVVAELLNGSWCIVEQTGTIGIEYK